MKNPTAVDPHRLAGPKQVLQAAPARKFLLTPKHFSDNIPRYFGWGSLALLKNGGGGGIPGDIIAWKLLAYVLLIGSNGGADFPLSWRNNLDFSPGADTGGEVADTRPLWPKLSHYENYKNR